MYKLFYMRKGKAKREREKRVRYSFLKRRNVYLTTRKLQKQTRKAQFFVGIATIKIAVHGRKFCVPIFLNAARIIFRSFSFGLYASKSDVLSSSFIFSRWEMTVPSVCLRFFAISASENPSAIRRFVFS